MRKVRPQEVDVTTQGPASGKPNNQEASHQGWGGGVVAPQSTLSVISVPQGDGGLSGKDAGTGLG